MDASLVEQARLLLLVVWSMVLGGIIGWERQLVAKPAGLRTHMLVAGAATLFTGVTAAMALAGPTGDPSRGAHGLITGIGFLGAGAILQQRDLGPSGLTTAATVIYTAVVGTAVAAGFGVAASVATLLAIAVLRILGRGRRDGPERAHDVTDGA